MSYNDRDQRKDGTFVGSSLSRKTYNNPPEIKFTGLHTGDGRVIPELQKIAVEVHDDGDYTVWHSKVPRELYVNPAQHPANVAERKRRRKEGLVEAPDRRFSTRTRSKIRNKIRTWYYTNLFKHGGNADKVRFSLLTLTFTESADKKGFTHAKCHALLNSFLTRMRQLYGLFSYVWVAELQDGKRNGYHHATGNIHYHIIIDRYFNVRVLNKLWLQALKSAGFATHTSTGKEANPLDLRAVKSAKHITTYLTKYVSKNKTALKVQLWNCSRSISRIAVGLYKVMALDELDNFSPTWRDDVIAPTPGLYVVPLKFTRYIYRIFTPLYQFNLNQLNLINHGDKNQVQKEALRCICAACNN